VVNKSIKFSLNNDIPHIFSNKRGKIILPAAHGSKAGGI